MKPKDYVLIEVESLPPTRVPQSPATSKYRVVFDHHRGRTNYEHRMVMEAHLGRELLREENVVHLDGNPWNNDLSNLRVVSPGERSRMFPKYRNLPRHACVVCGQGRLLLVSLCQNCRHKQARAQRRSKQGLSPCVHEPQKGKVCTACGERGCTRKGLCHRCYMRGWSRRKRGGGTDL